MAKGGFENEIWHLAANQKREKRSREVSCEKLIAEKSWVANTIPSLSVTAPIPVCVQSLRMLYSW